MGGHAGQGEFTTLGETVTRTGGVIQTGPFGSQLHASDYTLLGTPLIMPINLGDNEVIEAGISRIGDKDVRRLRRHALREGDIVFSRRGDVGRRSIIQEGQAGWLCGTGCLAARFGARRTEVNPEYVAHYLGSRPAQAWLQDHAVGGTMPNLNTAILSALPIRLPARPYQDVVVAMLEDAQAAVEHVRILIAKKQAIKQGLMQQLLAGSTRLPGFAGAWGEVHLGEISAPITKGATPTTYGFSWESSGIPFLRSECVSEHGLDMRRSVFISPAANHALRRSQIADGDILMTITGYVGRVVRLVNVGEANINQHIARVRIEDGRFDSGYVYHYLSQRSMREYYESIVTGQAYPQISLAQVRNTKIPAIPFDEQRAITAALDDADGEMDLLRQRLAKAQHVKKGVMQELLTGRTRLPAQGDAEA